MRWRADDGAGSVLALAIVAVVVLVALSLIVATAAFAARQRVVAAADAAALAAADVRLGVVAGDPCAVADRVARAHGARLTSCALDGAVATVEASAELLGVPIRITSRAGPP
ncbi:MULTISPECIES: Rv3654c family TadE-like protein [unclassified Salinibacterium]|uniref:Rv3654c family TadE-like protein n=1 Tax=unclassified Salinibacterium TaxID=2632331 RepID=UPI00141F2F5A|nr:MULTISPECIES: Rv3654c family TadE-like protein [unclassified Salinibacterium]